MKLLSKGYAPPGFTGGVLFLLKYCLDCYTIGEKEVECLWVMRIMVAIVDLQEMQR